MIRPAEENPQQTVTWQAAGIKPDQVQVERDSARKACAYLAGNQLTGSTTLEGDRGAVITLPLAVAERRVLGVIHLATSARPTESDLLFVNVVASQLAIALDRHDIEHKRKRAARRRAKDLEVLVSNRTLELTTANAELRTAKEELSLAHELKAQTLASLNEVVLVVDAASYRIEESNPMSLPMLGYTAAELRGRSLHLLLMLDIEFAEIREDTSTAFAADGSCGSCVIPPSRPRWTASSRTSSMRSRTSSGRLFPRSPAMRSSSRTSLWAP